jgi:hypothetical protein
VATRTRPEVPSLAFLMLGSAEPNAGTIEACAEAICFLDLNTRFPSACASGFTAIGDARRASKPEGMPCQEPVVGTPRASKPEGMPCQEAVVGTPHASKPEAQAEGMRVAAHTGPAVYLQLAAKPHQQKAEARRSASRTGCPVAMGHYGQWRTCTFPGSFRVSSLSVSGRLPDDGAGGDSSTGSEATEPVGFGSAGTLVN